MCKGIKNPCPQGADIPGEKVPVSRQVSKIGSQLGRCIGEKNEAGIGGEG